MEAVEVVIRLPEKTYRKILSNEYDYGDMNVVIQSGTPLPKGHGRLIDGDKLIRPEIQPFLYHLKNGDTAIPEIDILHAPTIIEADREVDHD